MSFIDAHNNYHNNCPNNILMALLTKNSEISLKYISDPTDPPKIN